ncbi:MAG: hypothetical protein Q8P51_01160 [Ignavibacteria bacterium]|nr:hypothetical protein [Ignavibacteria bacterium]
MRTQLILAGTTGAATGASMIKMPERSLRLMRPTRGMRGRHPAQSL